jgi:hypothetical protein
MSEWLRIRNDEIACFGEHSFVFSFPNGTYKLTISESEQHDAIVEFLDKKDYWSILCKEQSDSTFKVSGNTGGPSEILEDFYWYELIICSKPMINYWGDRVILRTDFVV